MDDDVELFLASAIEEPRNVRDKDTDGSSIRHLWKLETAFVAEHHLGSDENTE